MFNPIRRNRNIGKTQGGRVVDGKPEEKPSRRYTYLTSIYGKLSESAEIWQFYRDNPSRDWFHPCDEHDYTKVLRNLPTRYSKYVKAIIVNAAAINRIRLAWVGVFVDPAGGAMRNSPKG